MAVGTVILGPPRERERLSDDHFEDAVLVGTDELFEEALDKIDHRTILCAGGRRGGNNALG